MERERLGNIAALGNAALENQAFEPARAWGSGDEDGPLDFNMLAQTKPATEEVVVEMRDRTMCRTLRKVN